jgi:hypothetical protein
VRRYRSRRTDAVWVRMEWSPQALAAGTENDLRKALGGVVVLVGQCLQVNSGRGDAR